MANIPPPPQYRPNPQAGQNMLDLIMNQGQVQAQNAERQGQIWGSALQGIGQTLGAGIQQYGEQKQIKKRDAAWIGFVGSGEWEKDPAKAYATTLSIWGPDKAPGQWQALQATRQLKGPKRDPELDRKALGAITGAMDEMDEAGRAELYPQARVLTQAVFPEMQLAEQYDSKAWQTYSKVGKQFRTDKAPEGFTLNPGDTRYGADGKVIAAAPAAAKDEKKYQVTVPGPNGAPVTRLVTEAEMAGGVPTYQAPNSSQVPSLQHVTTAEGIRSFNPRTGEMGPVVGQPPAPARASRPPTGAERTNLGFYNRAAKAAEDIASKASENDLSLEEKVAKAGALDDFRLQYGSNLIQSPEQQQYRQAQRAFTEARLRKESGAAIPPAEYENDSKTYFAQPGDSKEVMKQKQEARASVLDSLRFSSGKAFEEYFGEPMPTPRNQSTGGAPPPLPGGAPGKGERRTINGKLAEWDGKGWLAVQ